MTADAASLDVLVIGAGQAGLAAGYYLAERGLSFLIIDRHDRIGDSWRNRYDSLTLFTPRSLSALPGLPLGGEPAGYPTRDEFVDYLAAYAEHYELPVRTGSQVRRLVRRGDGLFEASMEDGGTILARAVIVAAGGFQVPIIPGIAKGFAPAVRQLTPETYRNPSDIENGPVLVVGDGASGRDIAAELSSHHTVFLSYGRSRRLLPERILGTGIWKWLKAFGLLRVRPNTMLGRFMRKADPFPDRKRSDRDLEAMGVRLRPRLIGANGRRASFADGSSVDIGAVIWCVGYRDEFAWLAIDGAKDESRAIIHEDGRSPVAGLFYVGRPWQRNRASALVMGAGDDARLIVSAIGGGDAE